MSSGHVAVEAPPERSAGAAPARASAAAASKSTSSLTSAPESVGSLELQAIIALQRTAGNSAVSALLLGSPAAHPPGAGREVQRQEAGGGTPPAGSAELARQLAYQATVLRKVPPMSPDDQRVLGDIIGRFPIYQQLQERDQKRAQLKDLQDALIDYQNRNDAVARG
jgi:hypothetical protein